MKRKKRSSWKRLSEYIYSRHYENQNPTIIKTKFVIISDIVTVLFTSTVKYNQNLEKPNQRVRNNNNKNMYFYKIK